ncbi:MAG: hypothetical protein ACFCU8_18140 [Thermosynechococcaceae cyanobacterium]
MNNCPICSNDLLRHIGHGDIYWFCPHCWQELPNLESLESSQGKLRWPKAGRRPSLASHLEYQEEVIPCSA